jgi:hypothetical protein
VVMNMDIDFARDAVRASFRAGAELQELLLLSKERLAPEERKEFALGIAEAIYGIAVATMNKALAAHPELEAEIEADLAVFGRYR